MNLNSKIQRAPRAPDSHNWQVCRIKDVARINPATRIPKNQLVDFFPMDAIGVNGGLSHGLQKHSSEANGYSQFRTDDVLFAKVTPCFENEKSAIGQGLAVGVALATTEVIVLRSRLNITPAFLHYRIKGLDFAVGGKNEMKGSAGLKRVPEKFVSDFRFELPPLDDQCRIADWLDLQTTRIDKRRALLAKKRDLLSDLKTTIISEATSFGLDRTVATKFSGIDATGSIPQHWHIFRLKAMTSKIGSGKTPLGGSSVYSSSGTVFLRSQNIWDDGIRLNDVVYISDQIHHEMNATSVKPKDILLNITGASIGRSALVPVGFPAANVSQHVCIIRLRNKGVADYVALAMLSRLTKAQMAIDQIGAARDGLNFESIGQLPIPFPPTYDERRKIVDRVSNRVANINRQINLIDQLDDLLQQQRKAIIHEAVTGKIDLSCAVVG
ncbi:MAG: restriction endonuclease subunit S [Rhodoferax sp.]|nr:restriction endonuclease subunit S [Rhodoferax sp.]MBP8186195.1 restriction endonuclease subunit S [Comamonas sp.]